MRHAARARGPESDSGDRARGRSGRGIVAGALALATLAACRGFGPPPPELEALLPIAAESTGPLSQLDARVAIDSPALAGEFEAVGATAGEPRPGARLQLFGELGGKVLDLAVERDRFAGYFPHAGIGLAWREDEGPLPRHLLTFLAASLLESAAPIGPERVRGARRLPEGGGWELELMGLLAGVRLRAVVSDAGELLERRYEVRGVRWTERVGPPRVFRGGDVTLTLTRDEREPLEELPPGAFELELPEGFHP